MLDEAGTIRNGDRGTVRAMVEVLSAARPRRSLADVLPFLGPAFVAAVAYVDPGNFATNLQGGAQYGYTLIWVIVAANLMGMLVQSLSAKLGIASGKNLAENCRAYFPTPVVWGMWVLMELVAMATDLAEFVGAALGLSLLFGLPLAVSGVLTAAATFALLGIERFGFRPVEAVIGVFVALVAGSYVVELFLAKPDWRAVAYHAAVPSFKGAGSIYVACGILGATVMPHVIFLHSALMQERLVTQDPEQRKRLHRFEIIDIVVAMGVAGLINAAMLIMAAKTFHGAGMHDVDALDKAYLTLEPLLGRAASVLFAVSLLAAGLSSSVVARCPVRSSCRAFSGVTSRSGSGGS
jgi:manganese transport protein